MHTPVLLKEVIQYLDLHSGDFIVDGTVDGGGHGAEILRRILPAGKLLGIDWDETMIAKARERISAELQIPISKLQKNLVLERENYAYLPEILEKRKLPRADGLLLDLGFSSEQLEQSGRGFSFQKDEPLIMTYAEERKPVAQILRELSEKELADIIYKFGGERFSRRIAGAIKEKGRRKPILTTKELREAVVNAVPKNYERGRIDPATRTFQALRIYANDELGNLQKILGRLPDVLGPEGHAVVISFHSLEDKIVKDAFRGLKNAGKAELLTKKPIMSGDAEVKANPCSRSAKLRAIVMK